MAVKIAPAAAAAGPSVDQPEGAEPAAIGPAVRRFRFHGLRKLNLAERTWHAPYCAHMVQAGLDRWIEPGRLMIVVGAEKQRLLVEAEALGQLPAMWITQPYTIESYLPAAWGGARRFVETDEEGRTRVTGISKVELAARFQRKATAWATSFAAGSDVPERAGVLVAVIQAWQTPQEIIEATFLPPFLRDPDPDKSVV